MITSTDVPSEVTVSAVITRADGTVEDLGVISAAYKSPWRQLWWDLVEQRRTTRRIKRLGAN